MSSIAASPWVRRFSDRICAGGTVLDIACGSGRHSRYFAARGHPVTAVDIETEKVKELSDELRVQFPQYGAIEIIAADLEQGKWPLAGRRFDGIVVANYLYRPHFPLLCDALAINGVLLFDTFAAGNEFYGRPRDPQYLLEPGELLHAFADRLQVIAYELGKVTEPKPAMRQRICAVRIPEP